MGDEPQPKMGVVNFSHEGWEKPKPLDPVPHVSLHTVQQRVEAIAQEMRSRDPHECKGPYLANYVLELVDLVAQLASLTSSATDPRLHE